jgi:hypothetical protein
MKLKPLTNWRAASAPKKHRIKKPGETLAGLLYSPLPEKDNAYTKK